MTTIYIEEIKDGKLIYKIKESSKFLAPRVKGREGRIKTWQMGKRVDNMRTHITGDPFINVKDIVP